MHDVAAVGVQVAIECRPLTKVPSFSMRASAAAPMRVMMRMFSTTYGLSVISTPQRGTAKDRAHAVGHDVHRAALHAPANRPSTLRCASAGSIQLLFGPASPLFFVQMKVRCSTRATSEGCERCR